MCLTSEAGDEMGDGEDGTLIFFGGGGWKNGVLEKEFLVRVVEIVVIIMNIIINE